MSWSVPCPSRHSHRWTGNRTTIHHSRTLWRKVCVMWADWQLAKDKWQNCSLGVLHCMCENVRHGTKLKFCQTTPGNQPPCLQIALSSIYHRAMKQQPPCSIQSQRYQISEKHKATVLLLCPQRFILVHWGWGQKVIKDIKMELGYRLQNEQRTFLASVDSHLLGKSLE